MSLWRTKYAGELAVLSTWLCALLPWSVTVLRIGEVNTDVVYIRFLPLRFLYVLGDLDVDEHPLKFVWEVPGFVNSPGVTQAALVWLLGAAVLLVAVGLSVAYYAREDIEDRLPVDPVRVLGALLGLAGLVFLAATALLWEHQAGTTVPVGVPFYLVLGAALLTVERVE